LRIGIARSAIRAHDEEETPEERMEDFHEHLIRAVEEHLEEFTDNKTPHELMLTYLSG
jgi:hypothetical protein